MTILLIAAAFLLVLLNAFFVAAEFGMVRLRTTRAAIIAEEYPWRGRILARVHSQLDAYLSACQLGITLASLGLGWIGEPAFSELISPLLHQMGIQSQGLVEFISFVFAFSLLSFLHIVVGELMPKSLAIRQSEQISLWTAAPLYYFYWLMFPIIWMLNYSSNFFLKLLGLDVIHPGEQSHSSEEIKLILQSSQQHGELSSQESNILAQTLELADLRADDVMQSSNDMIKLPNPVEKDSLIEILNRYRYSRYPVFDQKTKKIIGLLHVKDIQPLLHRTEKAGLLNLQELVRPIPKVSYRMPALVLLRRFQEGMPHFALIVSRQGGIIGFITLDNLLHLVLGVIKDEFHKTQDAWIEHKDGSFTVKGDCPLYTIERALHRELSLSEEQEEEAATIAGLILHQLGSVPTQGETIEFNDFVVRIEQMQGARIAKVRIKPLVKAND
ncbi:hemolysin family protein [Legionella sp. 16cNR16C]|uniref:hemolysin family protein n=1 Tax=Legionella sp. 16cNR16C TaxID=2905656 RepID=UPI001E59CBFC|nr:hemolysin family protein [Legionella sp. 16cNR16C]MCE3045498.1 hemolysin family protein [Legionella sp. 16cNR16C]